MIAAATAALAYYEALRGHHAIEFGVAELARSEHLPRAAPWQITPAVSVGARLLWAGELDRAREVLRRAYDTLVRQGRMLMVPLMSRTCSATWSGGPVAGPRPRRTPTRLERFSRMRSPEAHLLACAQVMIAVSLGRADEARELGEANLRTAERYEDVNVLRLHWALGHVALVSGDPTAAAEELGWLPEALQAFGCAEPGWQPMLPDVVEALVTVGRLDEAQGLQQLEQQAAALEHRWATPASVRCRAGLLAQERADEAAAPPSRLRRRSRRSASRTALDRCSSRAPPNVAPGSVARRLTRSRPQSTSSTSSGAALGGTGRGRASAGKPAPTPRPRADERRARVAALVAEG